MQLNNASQYGRSKASRKVIPSFKRRYLLMPPINARTRLALLREHPIKRVAATSSCNLPPMLRWIYKYACASPHAKTKERKKKEWVGGCYSESTNSSWLVCQFPRHSWYGAMLVWRVQPYKVYIIMKQSDDTFGHSQAPPGPAHSLFHSFVCGHSTRTCLPDIARCPNWPWRGPSGCGGLLVKSA